MLEDLFKSKLDQPDLCSVYIFQIFTYICYPCLLPRYDQRKDVIRGAQDMNLDHLVASLPIASLNPRPTIDRTVLDLLSVISCESS